MRWGWVVAVVGVVLLGVVALGVFGEDSADEDSLEEITESVDAGAEECGNPLPDEIGNSLEVGKPRGRIATALDELRERGSEAVPAAISDNVSYLVVERGNTLQAVLVVIPFAGLDEGANATEALNGFAATLESQGIRPQRTSVAGSPALKYETQPEAAAVVTLPCHLVIVNTASVAVANRVAVAVVEDAIQPG